MSKLNGKVIVITGACGLLGEHFTRFCVSQGGKVVIADVNPEAGKKLEEEFGSANAFYLNCDITKWNSIELLIIEVTKKCNRIDAVINNAYPRNANYGKKLEDVSPESFNENLNLHLGGYFTSLQVFTKFFLQQGFGNVISMGSIYGVVAPHFEVYDNTPMTMPVEYAAIKSAIIHLTKYYAEYYKEKNIRFNAISPGGIFNHQPTEFVQRYEQFAPMLQTSDLFPTLLHLLSDDSLQISGKNFIVDNGWTEKIEENRKSN